MGVYAIRAALAELHAAANVATVHFKRKCGFHARMAALHASRPTRCTLTTRCTSLGCLQIAPAALLRPADGPQGQAGQHAVHRSQDEAEAGDVLCAAAGPQERRARHDWLQRGEGAAPALWQVYYLHCCWAASLRGQP